MKEHQIPFMPTLAKVWLAWWGDFFKTNHRMRFFFSHVGEVKVDFFKTCLMHYFVIT